MAKKKLKPDPFLFIFLPKFFPVNMMSLELFCDVTSSPQRKARLRLGSVAAALVDSPQQSVDST